MHDEQSEDMDDLSEETEESCRDDDSCADLMWLIVEVICIHLSRLMLFWIRQRKKS